MRTQLSLSAVILLFSMLSPLKNAFSQNIGIGTINPTKGKLEVSGAVGTTSTIFGGDGAGISLQRNYPAIGFNQYYLTEAHCMLPGTSIVQYLDMPSGSLVIDSYAAGTQPNQVLGGQTRRITMRNNGNVSIATYDQNASLFVSGHIPGISTVRFRGTTHHSVFADRLTGLPTQHTYINAGKTGSHVFINDVGLGNVIIGGGTTRVGINRPDPQAVLEIKQVAGRGLVLVAPAYSFNNWGFTVNHEDGESGSDLWVYYNEGYKGNFFHVDGLYYQGSDRRIKTNIAPIPSTLNKVMAMRPVTYTMKYHNPGQIESIGFIAQEVKSLFPALTQVITGEEHGYKGINDLHTMNYDALGPIAIKAIQEQQQKITLLQAKNAALRLRLEAAEKALGPIR
ncbi:MAG: tail fiber domain-containing protein [Bacteroidota bacterium]